MPTWNALLTLPPRPLALLGALTLWLGAFDLASAQVPYDDTNTPEGWVLISISRVPRLPRTCSSAGHTNPPSGKDRMGNPVP